MKFRNVVLFFLAIPFSACTQVKKEYKSPSGYNLNQPETFKMQASLFEISGITFAEGNKETLYAIQDEDGKVFRLKWGSADAPFAKFGKHGDFEDVSIINNYVFILRSDGTLFNLPFEEVDNEKVNSVNEFKNLVPAGEYEGLFARKDTKEIYLMCKNCAVDKKQEQLSGYVLQLDDSGKLQPKSTFTIDTREIAVLSGAKKTKFSPSAFAFNYSTREWFIVSSVNKMLVVTGEDWKVKQVYKLNSATFNQPEGIAFDIDNNLYISKEGGNTDAGTILKFPLQKAGH